MSTITEATAKVVNYNITDAAIAVMAEQFMPLTIAGIEDRDGYERVHKARMVVKNKRVEVEKMRKALKEDALRYGRQVDSEAKRITALLEPIETHLERQQDAIDAAKQRIIDEARLKAEAEARAKAEAEEAKRRAEQAAQEARLKAIRDAEDARLKAEREKLDTERRAMEAARRAEQEKLDAERRLIEAERKRLADIETARLRAIEDERIRNEAAERARVETEARIAKEAAEAKAKAEAEAEAKLRWATTRPDREKLLAVAEAVEAIVVPDVSELSPDAQNAAGHIRCTLDAAAQSIRDTAEGVGIVE